MFTINTDKSIHLTRGDVAVIAVSAAESEAGLAISAAESEEGLHIFQVDDVVRFQVFEKNRCDNIVLVKDVVVQDETQFVDIYLESEDTRIGDIIHRPKDYWYEVELNPDTEPQTLIGYDEDGPKIFRLYPEGDDG